MLRKAVLFIIVSISTITFAASGSNFGQMECIISHDTPSNNFPIVSQKKATSIYLDNSDYPGVIRAAKDLQQDIVRVTDMTPELNVSAAPVNGPVIIVGTLDKNSIIKNIIQAGKLDISSIKGKWESYIIAVVDNPMPGISQALVITGSDRRGTIYGIYEISRQIGVSPWYWWADVPVPHKDNLYIKPGMYRQGPPAVKYRGIFINDEDWGMHQWAKMNYEEGGMGIGPKTYEKIFELMLRLRLNYIWPAMHKCSREFASIPENVELAHYYGIVAGASHCEPMLFNNVKWDENKLGRWDYAINQNTIYSTWQDYAKNRGDKEAVWTLGMRGIHDRGMQGVRDSKTRMATLEKIFADQRGLLDKYVTKEWGGIAQAFVPYKEVLRLYDAGLKVPDDVTLVWVDDNFGYIRRLSSPEERKRSGGSGVYYHISYYGGPHSYLWINTTAPALMWEELHKAWENQARTLWVINVGDLKPAEIGIDYFSRFAWNADSFGPDSQPLFIDDFSKQIFGSDLSKFVASLLTEFYRLGTIRKPELMHRSTWSMLLSNTEASQLRKEYTALLNNESTLSERVAPAMIDAYTELVGFPSQILASTGLLFLADREIQFGVNVEANQAEIERLRKYIDDRVYNYNKNIAGGKWDYMMPGAVTREELERWSSQVRWPWGEKNKPDISEPYPDRKWRNAAAFDRKNSHKAVNWVCVSGLGQTGQALALKPVDINYSWTAEDNKAPSLEYDFQGTSQDINTLLIDFLPTFRIYPGMKLRIAVSIDGQPSTIVEVPGSSGSENESGKIRVNAVQNNYARAVVNLPQLASGTHTLKIQALDPGVVIDRISLP